MNRLTKYLLSGTALAVAGLIAAAPVTAGEVDAGKLWLDKRAKCEFCHGADGKGKTKMGKKMHAPNMTDAKWQKSMKDDAMVKAILEGFERDNKGKKFKHPKLKEGTEAEAKALVQHIRAFAADKKGKAGEKGAAKK